MPDGPTAVGPRASVVLSFLDELRFLEAAVATVRAQDETNWELLLIDDGSTDGSGALADQLATEDPVRIRVLRHPGGRNRGLPASRNLGFHRARGAFVFLLDADDTWETTKLAQQLAHFAAHPTAGMVCGPARYRFLGADLPDEVRPVTSEAPRLFQPPSFARGFVWGPVDPPSPSSVAFRSAVLRHVGGVPDGPNMYEDQRLFVAVGLHSPVFVSDEVLSTYTVRPDSVYGAVAEDRPTFWRHRVEFERWIVRRGPRMGVRGVAFTAEALARKGVAHFRAVFRRFRRGGAGQ